MPESQQETSYKDPRYVRDQIYGIRTDISEIRDEQRSQDIRLDQHEDLIRTLTTVVKGNAEIQHGGLLTQVAEIVHMVAGVKSTQEQAERERQAAKERLEEEKKQAATMAELKRKTQRNYVIAAAFGLSMASVPGVLELVNLIKGLVP